MNKGGWQSGPKRNTQRRGKEYKAMKRAQVAESKAKKKEQGGREASNVEESSSRGLREAASVSDDHHKVPFPVYREGDFVKILRDARPGVSYTFSYDKEGKVVQVIDGEGGSPNLYIVKLLRDFLRSDLGMLWRSTWRRPSNDCLKCFL